MKINAIFRGVNSGAGNLPPARLCVPWINGIR